MDGTQISVFSWRSVVFVVLLVPQFTSDAIFVSMHEVQALVVDSTEAVLGYTLERVFGSESNSLPCPSEARILRELRCDGVYKAVRLRGPPS